MNDARNGSHDAANTAAPEHELARMGGLEIDPRTKGPVIDGNFQSSVPGIFAAVPYCIDLIGGPYLETDESVCKAFRPKSALRKT